MKAKQLNILGLVIFSISSLVLIGFGLYEFFLEAIFKETTMPFAVKLGITGLILGIVIILISLIFERIKDYKEEK